MPSRTAQEISLISGCITQPLRQFIPQYLLHHGFAIFRLGFLDNFFRGGAGKRIELLHHAVAHPSQEFFGDFFHALSLTDRPSISHNDNTPVLNLHRIGNVRQLFCLRQGLTVSSHKHRYSRWLSCSRASDRVSVASRIRGR